LSRPPSPSDPTDPGPAARDPRGDRRLGRGLDSFSHLFFSKDDREPALAEPPAERTAVARASIGAPNVAAAESTALPRAVFVTGFRRGCGKTFVASSIADAGRALGMEIAEWQLATGVVVPRRGERFGLPVPHPSDESGFRRLADAARRSALLLLDGPVSLVDSADPFATSASEFLVIALPGREGAAEAYAAVKRIAAAIDGAEVRVLVNRIASHAEAREVFHRIADVASRSLGLTVRAHGGVPTLAARGARPSVEAAGAERLFARLARTLVTPERGDGRSRPFIDEAWSRAGARG
jgi:hypothetical protein